MGFWETEGRQARLAQVQLKHVFHKVPSQTVSCTSKWPNRLVRSIQIISKQKKGTVLWIPLTKLFHSSIINVFLCLCRVEWSGPKLKKIIIFRVAHTITTAGNYAKNEHINFIVAARLPNKPPYGLTHTNNPTRKAGWGHLTKPVRW